MMKINDNMLIHPENPEELYYWAKKWGVSNKDVCDAILATGSLQTEVLKEYVHRDKWIYHPMTETAKLIKAGINLIF